MHIPDIRMEINNSNQKKLQRNFVQNGQLDDFYLMRYAYQIHKQDAAYFLTLTVVGWADAFMRPEHKDLVCKGLNHCVEHKGLEIFAYVIMSSHIHMIARAKNGDLSDIIRDFKKYTISKLIKEIKQEEKAAGIGF